MNEQRDNSYYEAHVADVSLDEITSSDRNKRTLQRLRDGDIHSMSIGGSSYWDNFAIIEDDDWGWLGYFIGRSESLKQLKVDGSPEDEEMGQQITHAIHALSDGIAKNRSIQKVCVISLSNDGFAAITRALGNLTQLESFSVDDLDEGINNPPNPLNDCVALGNLLESGVRLQNLSLNGINIGDAGATVLARGLRCIGSSLKGLRLCDGSIGSEGLSTLAAALTNCTCLEKLDLSHNDFSTAAAGLSSLSDWLQTADLTLNKLRLMCCEINDGGLEALAEGAMNNCKEMNLDGNSDIEESGWRNLSTSLQSESCCLERLVLCYNYICGHEAEIIARGLVGNESLKYLCMFGEDEELVSITPTVWSAFIKVLCDTSTINNTYLSNHTIIELWEGYREELDEVLDKDLVLYLDMNKQYPQHAAQCKILMNHTHLDMKPLLQWELKCLPLAVSWFERAKPCTTLSIYENDPKYRRRLVNESDEVFQSRVLTALFEFVRGVPKRVLERRGELIMVAAYDEKIARLLDDVQQRKRKISQLNEENKRLRGIVQSVRNAVDY